MKRYSGAALERAMRLQEVGHAHNFARDKEDPPTAHCLALIERNIVTVLIARTRAGPAPVRTAIYG